MWHVMAWEPYGAARMLCHSAVATEPEAKALGRSELSRGLQVRIFWNNDPDEHSLGLGSD